MHSDLINRNTEHLTFIMVFFFPRETGPNKIPIEIVTWDKICHFSVWPKKTDGKPVCVSSKTNKAKQVCDCGLVCIFAINHLTEWVIQFRQLHVGSWDKGLRFENL